MAETRTSMALPVKGCHPSCDEVGRLLIGEQVPVPFPTDAALGIAGLREKIHPRDAYAFLVQDRTVAEKYAAANRDHYGHVVRVFENSTGQGLCLVDMREALREKDIPITDPALPDNWAPTGNEQRR